MPTQEEIETQKKQNEMFKDVEVIRDGSQIVLPEKMLLATAIEWLKRRMVEEEQKVAIDEVVDAFPLEGAYAFAKALSKRYGFTALVPTPGFFGSSPPVMIGVETDVHATTQVPWGRIQVPGIEGHLETDIILKDKRLMFRIGGEVKQKHKRDVAAIAQLTRDLVRTESIYRGKAIRISFPDPENPKSFNPRDCPKFIDTTEIVPAELIFSSEVSKQVNTSLFTPIERTAECREYQIPLKRGILLEGPYGCGKTLTAHVAAKKCIENKWTFIYLADVTQLEQAIHFAKQYQPAVIFAEDIDHVMNGDREEDEGMNDILNTIDGVDTKNAEIVIVLTTNFVEKIDPAMMRPGRLDAVVSVQPPDAAAAVRLVELYARGRLDEKDDFKEVGVKLAGQIPATIREVVERSKLAAVSRLEQGEKLFLRAQDLQIATDQMLRHLELMRPKKLDDRSDAEKAAVVLGASIEKALGSKPPTNGKSDKTEHTHSPQ